MPFGISAGTASLIGAGVSAGGSLLGGLFQSNAASKAQAQAQQALQQQRADLAPYREAAVPALNAQGALLGLQGQPAADAAMANFQASPGYQYQVQQGLRAVDQGAAATGMLRSGATLKAEQTLGANLANLDFGNYYNRLMGLSTLGEDAAKGGASTAGQSASAALGGGTAQSSIYGNTFSGIGNTINSLLTRPNLFGSSSAPGGAPGSATPIGYQASTGNTWYS